LPAEAEVVNWRRKEAIDDGIMRSLSDERGHKTEDGRGRLKR
jgi:hypothetical protein